jgi:uncharacterized repeat protein (TIGR01451 family)
MTRLNFLQNRRLLTLILLGVTLLFGGLAVFLAIAINNRQVNPDDTSAATKCSRDSDCRGGQYCDTSTCPAAGYCVNNGSSLDPNDACPDDQCRTEDRGTKCGAEAGCPAGQGKTTRVRVCGGNEEDTSDKDCTPKTACQATPTGGGANGLNRCFTFEQSFPENGCADPSQKINVAVDCSGRCPSSPGASDGVGCIEVPGECGGAAPPLNTPAPIDTSSWPAGAKCRISVADIGKKCVEAEFKRSECDPKSAGHGQMCFCTGTTIGSDRGGWRFKSEVAYKPVTCGGSCDTPSTASGGTFNAAICGNDYYCEPDSIAPPPSVPEPSCISRCDASVNQEITTCNYPGQPPIEVGRRPKQCNPSCGETVKCEGSDLVNRDCQGEETGRIENYPPCLERRPLQTAVSCDGLTVTKNGQEIADGATINPGDVLTLNVNSNTPNGLGSRYAYSPDNGANYYVIDSGNQFNDQINPRQINFTIPANAQPGSTIKIASTVLFKIDPAGTRATQCANGNCETDTSNTIVACGGTNNVLFTRTATAAGNAGSINPSTGAITQEPVFYSAAAKATVEARLQAFCSDGGNCLKTFAIGNTPVVEPAVCTGITVLNSRTNQNCGTGNPASCGLRQGDPIEVTVEGSGNVVNYTLSVNENVLAPNATGQFGYTLPQSATNYTIVGNVTNGVTPAADNPACRNTYSFTPVPGVDKTIDATNSLNLTGGNVVTGSSEVEYDISITNTGNGILNNVLVVDRLSAYDPNNVVGGQPAPVTPFGDIIRADDLTRTTGTNSTPSPVAPQKVFNVSGSQVGSNNPGNTYTSAPFNTEQLTTVHWNRINALHPAETYTGSIRVDIGAFTGNPALRNTVCLYNDVNGNGEYDEGTDTPIECDEVDVFTQTPTFTIVKSASKESVGVGESLDYTLTLTNTSNAALDLNNLTVTDTLDPDYINGITVSNISNGGTRTNNVITWTGANLVAANGGNANLSATAPNNTLTLTFRITIDTDFFTANGPCSAQMSNVATSTSTTPEYGNTSPTIYITVTRVCTGTTPPPTGTLPPTGNATPYFIPVIGLAFLAGAVYFYRRNMMQRSAKVLETSAGSAPESGTDKLRSKIRMRK